MADSITTVLFKLEADSASLRSDLTKVNQDLGNTEKSATKASGSFASMGEGLKAIARQAGLGGLVDNLEVAQKTATTATTAVKGIGTASEGSAKKVGVLSKVFKALLGPVGLLLAAITALTGAFISTQRGAEAFSRFTNVINAVIQRTIGLIQDIATGLVDTFQKSPKEIFKAFTDLLQAQIANRVNGVIKLFSSLGDVIKGAFTLDLDLIKEGLIEAGKANLQLLTGIEDIAEKAVDFYDDAIKRGLKIAEIELQISKNQINLRKEVALLNQERNKQLEIARNTTLALEDQLEANLKAQQLSQQISNRQIEVLQKERDLQIEINDLNSSKDKDLQKVADIEAQIIELQTQAQSENLRNSVRQASIEKEIQDRNREIVNERLELLGEEIKLTENFFNDRINALKEIKTTDANVQRDINELVILLEREKNDTIRKINRQRLQDQLNDELNTLEKKNKIQELKLREELANFKGSEEDKAKLAIQFTKRQVNLLTEELNKLDSIYDQLLPDEKGDIDLKIQSLKTQIAELNATISEGTEEAVGNFNENFNAIAGSIENVFSEVLKRAADATTRELARIDEALKKSESNQEEALDLARRGNVEALEIERARQDELERQREIALRREERQARQQIAIQQALAAAQILAEVFKPGGAVTLPTKLALAGSLIGFLGSLVPAFEDGTLNAPGGLAMVDEKGAELRFGKDGKLKDLGSNRGARLVNTDPGDIIVPAHISRQLLDDMALPRNGNDTQDLRLEKAIKGMQSETKVMIDSRGLYVGIKGVKQQLTRAWQ
jgi:hypothetical protein